MIKKIDESIFKCLATPYSYVSYMTYARLLIPQLIPENKVLYLDSDIIVNDKLDSLFNIPLKDHYVAATPDPLRGFNAGVMLINNQLFHHNPHKVKQLFNVSQNKENAQADQTALNIVFGDTYLKLSNQYNYMISGEQYLTYNYKDLREKHVVRLNNVTNPKIIHYAGGDKPWSLTSGGLMRDIWWQYRNLSWENVLSRRLLEPVRPKSKGEFFTFTPTDDLFNIKSLIKQLPEYTFNIAAWVPMSSKLISLLEYPNVRLYSRVSEGRVQQLVRKCDLYLDINSLKEGGFSDKFSYLGKPIFSFASVARPNNHQNYHVFADNDIHGMVKAINKIFND